MTAVVTIGAVGVNFNNTFYGLTMFRTLDGPVTFHCFIENLNVLGYVIVFILNSHDFIIIYFLF